MCRLLVGLAVDVVGVVRWTDRLQVHVTTSHDRPSCSTCSTPAVGHGVQNDTLGRRGRKHDPLWRARRLLVMADEHLAERIKRVAFGIVNWNHWRIRVLLYAGGVDWSKLAGVTPSPT